jgi:ATP-dependent Clp protease ATP-binding subunit ClpA
MNACKVDLVALREGLTNYIDNELKPLVTEDDHDSRPTVGFQRVVRNATLHVQELSRDTVTGADVLAAMFDERESCRLASWRAGDDPTRRRELHQKYRATSFLTTAPQSRSWWWGDQLFTERLLGMVETTGLSAVKVDGRLTEDALESCIAGKFGPDG